MEQARLADVDGASTRTADSPTSTAHSLYRTWRSRTFGEVIGQGHVTQTLRNAVRMGTVGHAYLCTGPRGTGKTSTARLLARAVNCLDPQDGEPCNTCAPCRSQLEGRCLDVVEIDAASHTSVDNVRDLREKVPYAPTEVRRKVYIIDEVHMLSTSAFNALLKTLEEPPDHVLFVLATTDVHKVPATVSSRCQRLDFRVIGVEDIVDRLAYVCGEESIVADAAALHMIAQQATGSLRDALSLLEQVRAYEPAVIGLPDVEAALGLARRDTLHLLAAQIIAGDTGAALTLLGSLGTDGADMRQYARQLIHYWRDLLLACATGPAASARAHDPVLSAQASTLTVHDVTTVIKAILQPDYSGRRSASAQWQLELAVAEACAHFAAAAPATPGALPVPASSPAAAARPSNASGSQPATVAPMPQTRQPVHLPPATGTPPVARTTPTTGAPAAQAVEATHPAPAKTVQAEAAPSSTERAKDANYDAAAARLADPAPRNAGTGANHAAPPRPVVAAAEPEPAPMALRFDAGEAGAGRARGEAAAAAIAVAPPSMSPPASTPPPPTTPPSAPAPVPQVGVPAAPIDIADVWMRTMQAASPGLRTMLDRACTPARIDGTTVVLTFRPQCASLEREMLDSPPKRVQIEEVLQRIAGTALSVRFESASSAARASALVEQAATQEPRDTFVEDAERQLRGLHMERKRV